VAAYKTSSACHQHSVALAAWLRFHHTTKSLLCCLHIAKHLEYVCNAFISWLRSYVYKLRA
jgi:hypothetical protein